MIVTVNSNENSTSSYFNSTAWDDLNFTSGTTFVAFTESTVLSSTTRTSSGTEPPPLPAEPLPVSGRLPTPVTAGACPWTQHRFVLFFSKVPLLMLQTVLKLFTLTVFFIFFWITCLFSQKKNCKYQVMQMLFCAFEQNFCEFLQAKNLRKIWWKWIFYIVNNIFHTYITRLSLKPQISLTFDLAKKPPSWIFLKTVL